MMHMADQLIASPSIVSVPSLTQKPCSSRDSGSPFQFARAAELEFDTIIDFCHLPTKSISKILDIATRCRDMSHFGAMGLPCPIPSQAHITILLRIQMFALCVDAWVVDVWYSLCAASPISACWWAVFLSSCTPVGRCLEHVVQHHALALQIESQASQSSNLLTNHECVCLVYIVY